MRRRMIRENPKRHTQKNRTERHAEIKRQRAREKKGSTHTQ
jgi:hypothetical protein